MRRLLVLGSIFVLLFAFGSTGTAEAATYTLRWAHVYAPDHPFHIVAEEVARDVAERTGGAVEIQVFPASQLGSEKDIVEAVAVGMLDMAIAGAGELGKWHSPYSIFEAAYVFRDSEHALKVAHGTIGEEMARDLLQDTGLRVLDTWYYGTRHMTTNRPVHTPADLQGMKLRVPDQPIPVANARALGANPTPMALNEVYLALQQGVVDGQENPIATIATQKFYEVQRYINLTSHVVTLCMVVVGDQVFQSLPAEYREALEDSVREHTARVESIVRGTEEDWIGRFAEAGMEVNSDIDVPAFQDAAASLKETFGAQWGPDLWDRVQAVH